MLGSGTGSGRSVNIKRIVKDGLQAWYKADKTQGPSGSIVNSIEDNSLNDNHGVLYSGKALSFDGNDQKVDFGNPGYSMKTLAFWINLDSTTEKVLKLTSSQSVEVSSGTITLNGTWTGSVIYVDTTTTSTIAASSWKRVVITITSAITVDDLQLGSISTDFGDFDMADLQIYDSTWSASDVAYDYSNPDKDVFDNGSSSILNTNCLALYRLNEGAGDRVYNAAPVSRGGVLYLSKSYAQANFDSGWVTAQQHIPQYAMSSYSKKMIFDGVDDVVGCGSGSSIDNIFDGGGSWSAWFSVETDGEGSAGTMLCKGSPSLRTLHDAGGDVTMQFLYTFSGDNGGWTAPTDAVLLNKINHIVVTYDSSSPSNSPTIYINGASVTVNEGATPTGSASSDASQDFIIGAQNSSGDQAYDGFIDEVSAWDKELSATEVSEIFNSGIALDCRDHSAASDLQAYWRNNSTNQWDDLSDNSNHGTVSGSPTTIQLQEVPFFKKDTFGLPMNMVREKGLMLDGDSHLKVDDDNSLDITSNGTWEFWLKLPPQGMSADQFLFDKQGSYLVKVQSSEKIVFGSTQSSGARSTVYNTPLVVDKWYHVVITFDSSTTDGFTFYIDGGSVAISQGGGSMPAEALIATTNPLYIGAENDLTNDLVDGKLDDFKIYNRTLSAAEVSKNFRATKSKHRSTSNWSDDFGSGFI